MMAILYLISSNKGNIQRKHCNRRAVDVKVSCITHKLSAGVRVVDALHVQEVPMCQTECNLSIEGCLTGATTPVKKYVRNQSGVSEILRGFTTDEGTIASLNSVSAFTEMGLGSSPRGAELSCPIPGGRY